MCTTEQCAQLCSVLNCAVCSTVQCAQLCSVLNCAVCSTVQCAQLCSVLNCAVCTTVQCAQLCSVHNCAVCTTVRCAQLSSVHNCTQVCTAVQCAQSCVAIIPRWNSFNLLQVYRVKLKWLCNLYMKLITNFILHNLHYSSAIENPFSRNISFDIGFNYFHGCFSITFNSW